MKKTINIAIVAFGRIAKTHALAIYMSNLKFDLPFHLRVSHIITSRPNKIFFPDICVCKTLEEALNIGETIDIVDICNINEAHLNEIKTAVFHKKAIYCEKPLTDCIEKSKEACALVEKNNILTAVPLIFRYLPCVHLLKKELDGKELGKIISFEAKYYHNSYLDERKRNTWRTKDSSGGGASLDLGIHMLDCIRFIFNDPDKIINEKWTHFDNVLTDEIYRTTLNFDKKIKGELIASRIYSQEKQKVYFEVFCEKGSYYCDFNEPYVLKKNVFMGNTTFIKPDKNDSFMKYLVSESAATHFHLDAHMNCIVDFAFSVYGIEGASYYATFKEALLAQSLLINK